MIFEQLLPDSVFVQNSINSKQILLSHVSCIKRRENCIKWANWWTNIIYYLISCLCAEASWALDIFNVFTAVFKTHIPVVNSRFTCSRFTKCNIKYFQNISALYSILNAKCNANFLIHFSKKTENRVLYSNTNNFFDSWQGTDTLICWPEHRILKINVSTQQKINKTV